MNFNRNFYGKALVSGFIIAQSLTLAYFMRPIQDDYFNLYSVQEMGVFGYLKDTWLHHGGNMVQFLIHCLVILPTTQAFSYWNLALFFLLTQAFCFWTIRIILIWLFPDKPKTILFWIPLLSIAGFEGIFVPGFLGTFGFSLATLAHLWPVMAFVIGLLGLRRFSGSWLIALTLGLIAGNSNLGESAFALASVFLIFISFFKIQDFEIKSGIRNDSNFYALSLGILVGTIGIALAPGFWNRASDQVGLPDSAENFIFRFAESFASFTADPATHPMIWVILLLGLIFKKAGIVSLPVNFKFRTKMIAVGSVLIWMALIMGSTFAYPSWHQSMGMYILLFPAGFVLGTFIRNQFVIRNAKRLLVLVSIVMLLTFIRIGVLGVSRAENWDNNLPLNICALVSDPDADLLGAEIRYPPFNLGVEDVNTWKWMRDKYAGWVSNIASQKICP
jgi:hypothetical protein